MGRVDERELEPWIEAEIETCGGRTVYVDGFNVLHAAILTGRRGSDWWSAPIRERLLARVTGWPDLADGLWVVFDGAGPGWSMRIAGPRGAAGPEPRVHVVFAASADDWIVRRARRATDPTRVVVVSADRQVAGRARSAGCEVLAPRAFASRCGPAPEATADVSARPVTAFAAHADATALAVSAPPQDDFVAVSRAAAASPKVDS